MAHTAGGDHQWIHALLPLSLLAATGVWLRLHWDRIPARFPTHWDLAGNANGWSTRTIGGVFQPLVVGAAVCSMLMFIRFAISEGLPARSGQRNVRTQTLRLLSGVAYLMSLLFSVISLQPLFPEHPSPPWLIVFVLTGTAALAIPVIRAAAPDSPAAPATPDDAWKLGVFYYNPSDPAVMVEKRFGIGYTPNFGNRMSWFLMAAIIFLPLAAIFFRKIG